MSTIDVNDFLLGGGPSFKFKERGDTAKGTIVQAGVEQSRDFETGKAEFWDDGKPKMQLVVTLRQDDGEVVRVFCKPNAKAAIRDAVIQAGAQGLENGGTLAVQMYDLEPPAKAGMNPKQLFKAQYKAPVNTVSADDLL